MGGYFRGALEGCCGSLTLDLEDMVFIDVLDDLLLHHGSYPQSFLLIYLSEVCQEEGVIYKVTWRMLRVHDW